MQKLSIMYCQDVRISADQIQGVYPFDKESAVYIRIKLFEMTDGCEKKYQSNDDKIKVDQNNVPAAPNAAPTPNTMTTPNAQTTTNTTITPNTTTTTTTTPNTTTTTTTTPNTPPTPNAVTAAANAPITSNALSTPKTPTTPNVSTAPTTDPAAQIANTVAESNQVHSLKEKLKAMLMKFFTIWDKAFLSTKGAVVTVWKQGIRFYLFYCQSVNNEGRLSNIGEIKGALMTFMNLDELHEFLEINFGSNGLDGSFEIRSIDFKFIPLENCPPSEQCLWEKEKIKEEEFDFSIRLYESPCHCSSTYDQHMEKVRQIYSI